MDAPKKIRHLAKNLPPTESFIELNGVWVRCSKVGGWLLEDFQSQWKEKEPKPPKIEQPVVGGGKELVDDFDAPAYVAEKATYDQEHGLALSRLCFDHCEPVAATDEQQAEWSSKLRRWGLAPTHEAILKAFALRDERRDTETLMKEVMRLSTVTEEEKAKSRDRFQPVVDGRPERVETEAAEVAA